MTRRESCRNEGAKLALPFRVTARAFCPSAPATMISSVVGRTSPRASRARYSSSAAPVGRLARQTRRAPFGEKNAPPS